MTTYDTTPPATGRRSGRHPINVGHFVMGIAFLGIVAVWLLVSSDAVTGDDVRWLLPVPWVLAGVGGLLATTRRHRDSEEWREAAYADQARGWVGATTTPEPETQQAQAFAPPAPTAPTAPIDPDDPNDPSDPSDLDDPEKNPAR